MNFSTKLLVVYLVLASTIAQTACSSNTHDSNINNQTNNASYSSSKIKDTAKVDSKYIAVSDTEDKPQQNMNFKLHVATSVHNNEEIITPNGVQNIFLNDTIATIEKKIGKPLNLDAVSNKCSTASLNDLVLLFLGNKLISIDVFTQDYTTDKSIKVDDSYSQLKKSYPDGKYQSVRSSAGDESYEHESRYFLTRPNEKGNYYSFLLSDIDGKTIQSFSINQIPFMQDNGCGI